MSIDFPYSVEPAKSNRSSCKVCKQKIDKDALRIGTETMGAGDFTQTSWRHLECQKKPKRGLSGWFAKKSGRAKEASFDSIDSDPVLASLANDKTVLDPCKSSVSPSSS